jgi:hypothetical protein
MKMIIDLFYRIMWGIIAVWFAALVIDHIEWEIIKANTPIQHCLGDCE